MLKSILPLAVLLGSLTAKGQSGTAVRQLPFDFHPGDLIEVRLQVTPPVGTTNWSVREHYPVRWDFVSSTNASSTNEFTGELVFGPFTDAAPRTLSYEISSNPALTNSVTFAGTVTNNGATNPVTGTTFLPARNEWMFAGPQVLDSDSQVISGVAYGAGRWVVSLFGWVATIESGGRLTYPGSLGFHGDAYSRLSYVGGLFLLFGATTGGQFPLMNISDDGLSWKAAQSEPGGPHANPFAGSGGQVESVAYGNGVYVAAAYQYYYSDENEYQGAIFRSTNGYNWRRVFRLGNPSRRIDAVAFRNGLFMAVAAQGTLLTSTNGSDWIVIQPIHVIGDTNSGTTNSVWMTRDLRGICYGPAGWIIPTSDSTFTGRTLGSTDGNTWNELPGTGTPSGHFWQSFYADGKYWFSTVGVYYETSDGTSWAYNPSHSPTPPSGPVSRAPDGVNPQYLAAGVDPGALVSSTNGTAWFGTALDGQNGSGTLRWPRYLSAATFNNACVVGGQGTAPTGGGGQDFPTDRLPYVWMPQLSASVLSVRNGSGQWRNVHQDPVVAYGDFLATPNGLLAAGAFSSLYPVRTLRVDLLAGTDLSVTVSTVLTNLYRTIPVQQWKYPGLNYQSPAYCNAILATSPFGYDLFAESYAYYSSTVVGWGHFTSANGSNWVRRAIGLNDPTNFPAIRGLAWGAGRYVAVSEGSSPGITTNLTSPNRIYTSTDGESYTNVNLAGLVPDLNGEGLTGVAYGNGRFVAIGNAGRILSSTNGQNWVTVRNSDGHRWNRVRYLNGTWAAVGNAGWVAFSADGQLWNSRTAGTESDLTDIAQQNGSFVVVGSHAMVLVSLPVTPPTILSASLAKVPGLGLQFNVSGQVGRVLDIQTSSNLVNWTRLLQRTNTTGTITITDPEPNQERRFYRAVQQP